MIFAETERLYLRTLEREELPRMRELLNDWEIARWLSILPFPYLMHDAEEFYAEMAARYARNEPQFYALALKTDNLIIGGVGLHPPRFPDHAEGEIEIGYWLAPLFWGRGLMSEAACEGVKIAFARPTTLCVGATADIHNRGSQNVLRKAGLRDMGIVPRNYRALRGADHVTRWFMTREEYEKRSVV